MCTRQLGAVRENLEHLWNADEVGTIWGGLPRLALHLDCRSFSFKQLRKILSGFQFHGLFELRWRFFFSGEEFFSCAGCNQCTVRHVMGQFASAGLDIESSLEEDICVLRARSIHRVHDVIETILRRLRIIRCFEHSNLGGSSDCTIQPGTFLLEIGFIFEDFNYTVDYYKE